jgi:hypothetical protein
MDIGIKEHDIERPIQAILSAAFATLNCESDQDRLIYR